MKKLGVLLLSILVIGIFAACSGGYEKFWVLQKSKYSQVNDKADNLYDKAQLNPALEQYSVATISEGKKMVFFALGEKYAKQKVTVLDVKDEKDTTKIILSFEKEKGEDMNPVVYVGIDKVRKNVKIVDEKGKKIEEWKSSETLHKTKN